MRRVRGAMIVAGVLAALTSAPVSAQTEPPAEAREAPSQDERAVMLERLERRLAEVREQEETLLGAIERLERGEDVDAVRDDLSERVRDRFDEFRARRDEWRERRHERGPHREEGFGDVVEFLRDQDPRMFERLRRLRERSPERFERFLEQRAPRLREMMREREENPEVFAMRKAVFAKEREIFAHVRTLVAEGRADEVKKDEVLRDLVRERVRLQGALKRLEVQRLRERVEELEAEADAQAAAPAGLVDEQVARIAERVERFVGEASRGAAEERREGRQRGPEGGR